MARLGRLARGGLGGLFLHRFGARWLAAFGLRWLAGLFARSLFARGRLCPFRRRASLLRTEDPLEFTELLLGRLFERALLTRRRA